MSGFVPIPAGAGMVREVGSISAVSCGGMTTRRAIAPTPDLEAITGGFIRERAPLRYDDETHFACIEADPANFVHFNPPLGLYPGETVHEAHARQPWVSVAVLDAPIVPPGPVAAPEVEPTGDMLRALAPLVWLHVQRYGFAPMPYNPATWRG